MRCSALIEKFDDKGRATTILVDTGPDIRAQMLASNLRKADAVLYTHDHADHTHGIDDLRFLAYRMKSRIEIWSDARTRESLVNRFSYCFADPPTARQDPFARLPRRQSGIFTRYQ
jgi:phosphoribosyl 1,2-cyclic phosphate phosphodiesterase